LENGSNYRVSSTYRDGGERNIFKNLFGGTTDSNASIETIKNPKISFCEIGEDDQAAGWLSEDRSIYQDRYEGLFGEALLIFWLLWRGVNGFKDAPERC
jgi:hypothetical protein